MSFSVPVSLGTELDELITHYPQKRSASLMLLHAIQEHFGYISKEAIEWTAKKLDLQPINILELVTFYPMFRQEPAGKCQIDRHDCHPVLQPQAVTVVAVVRIGSPSWVTDPVS